MKACCVQGFIDSGTPTGTVEQIGGVKCYVGGLDSEGGDKTMTKKQELPKKKSIVIATDLFGYTLVNTRLIADSYTKAGYLTIVPDLFKGTEPPPELMESIDILTNVEGAKKGIWNMVGSVAHMLYFAVPFMMRNSMGAGKADIEKVIDVLRKERGVEKVGVVGYCWGGTIVAKIAQEKDSQIDVAIAAHAGQLKFPTDYEAIVKPSFWVIPENDHAPTKGEQQSRVLEILREKGFDGAIYPNANHGFAVRGDENNEAMKALRVKAFNDSLNFMKKYM